MKYVKIDGKSNLEKIIVSYAIVLNLKISKF